MSRGKGKKPEIATVIAPYQATSAEQLDLQRGQLIMIRKKTSTGWWEGELQAKGKKRQIGWFPASYVKLLGSSGSNRSTPVSHKHQEEPQPQQQQQQQQQEVLQKPAVTEATIEKVVALYSYAALNEDELSFEKDDIITLLAREETSWWRGELNGVSLGYGTTSFDGEIIAISESLRNFLCHINKFKNAVILSDSKAAILSIVSKHTPSSQTAEITKMLSQLISLNKIIVFQWIPSHCGILGNENADALAKKGSTATYTPVTKFTYYSVKRFIKSTYLDFNKQNLVIQSQGKKWNSLHHNPQLIPDLPRKSSVAAFRLATGHDCLAKHLHRIGIYQSPNCPLCNSNQEMDSEHLKICASVADHDNIFEKYWSARGQMTLLSNAWH
ncbi:hypothetical protein ANN_22843 [Periplaneta americana]|uniref:SH3 domain-containing protein n=1 Tax=Periplaneta americana TaxID=6978 RepID=A0ABQ8SJK4_PERAM|nr:hypothetical protein ANN_22843 [Periplaneta americana]